MQPVDAATIRRVRAQLVGDPDLTGRSLARRLSQQADSCFESIAAGLPAGWAVMATGGYARGTLAPGSDIDAVLLHPHKAAHDEVKAAAERLWYPFWDAGLKLSPAVHSTKTLLALAADDLDTATSLLAVRTLAGDPMVVAEVNQGALEQWRKRPFVWLQRLSDNANERWAKCGDVASLLEPDLKDGRGGLRDYDAIRWALKVDRPEIASALDGPVDDLAGPAELLLAARCELHRATGRNSNVLLLQDQDRVAEAMGFADADALMQNLAGAAHTIEWATERFWWRVDRLVRSGGRVAKAPHTTVLAPGVTLVDDEAHIAADADLDEQSFVFRFAATAAHAAKPMSGRALQMLASRGTPPGELWTEGSRRAFVSLLGSGAWLARTVEALERFDLFSRFLPEWRAVRSLPQRNAFHTYTVDHHLLQTIAIAGEFVRDVERPDLLLMGALMHDLGKGYPGDHTDAGVELLDSVMGRMGFDPTDRAVVGRLVRHHLLLPETATRRDLDDPRTAALVAEAVGDLSTLQLLRALSEADSRATGPSAWSEWKRGLMDQLVHLSAQALAGSTPSRRSSELPDSGRLAALVADGSVHVEHVALADVDLLRIASRDRAGLFAHIAGALALHGLDVIGAAATTGTAGSDGDGVAVDEFRIARVPPGAVPNWVKVEHDLRGALSGEVDVDARLEARLKSQGRRHRALSAVAPRLEVLVSNEASATATMVEVRAPDAPAVLYRLSHALAGLGLDIRSAVVATLGHEVVDVFYVTAGGAKLPEAAHGDIRAALKAALQP